MSRYIGDISLIYRVSEGFDTINHGDISERRNFGKYHQKITDISVIYQLEAINRRFFSLICCHKKKSPIFLQFIADFSAIFLQKENALLCPDYLPLCPGSLSPANLLLRFHSPLCLYMRPPRFHLLLCPGLSVYPSSPSPASLLPGLHSPFCPYIRPPFPFVNFNQMCVYIYIYILKVSTKEYFWKKINYNYFIIIIKKI